MTPLPEPAMTKQLLELAAKAAGIVIHHWSDGRLPYECPVLNDGINEYIRVFDPLTDDGDALRLAVTLKLWTHSGMGNYHDQDDPYAATRRAITRAAAEIGRGMK